MSIPVGERLWIKGDWDTRPVPAGRIPILIHPNPNVQGIGYESATKAILMWLEQHIDQHDAICDIGCGSGILGIAAVKLGVSKAFLTDAAQYAVDAAAANVLANGVSDKVLTQLGTVPIIEEASVSLVISNIGGCYIDWRPFMDARFEQKVAEFKMKL